MLGPAACGYASVEGDPIEESIRPSSASRLDAGSDAKSVAPEAPTAPDAGLDAKAASTTCTASDLVMCFRFEGNTSDQSAAPLTPATATGITFVTGKEEQAGRFTASSALRFAPNPAFDLPANAATVEAWINRENTGADAVVFDDDERLSLTINAAGRLWCKSSGGAVIGATVLPVNQWLHVACVVDGGTMKAYLNGAVDGQGSGAIASRPAAAAAIGGNSPDGEPFVGAIDSFRVFRSARTAAEIAAAAKP